MDRIGVGLYSKTHEDARKASDARRAPADRRGQMRVKDLQTGGISVATKFMAAAGRTPAQIDAMIERYKDHFPDMMVISRACEEGPIPAPLMRAVDATENPPPDDPALRLT